MSPRGIAGEVDLHETVELPVRDYAGAQEECAPGEEPSVGAEPEAPMEGMAGMEHGGMGGSDSQEALPMCEAAQ